MFVWVGLVSIFVGVLAVIAFGNIVGSVLVFVPATLVTGWYLYRKSLPSEVIGTGLYISAVLLIVTPVINFVPKVLWPGGETAMEAATVYIAGVVALAVYGPIFLVGALVLFVIGYYANQHAQEQFPREVSGS